MRPLTLGFHLRTFLNFIVGKLFKRRPRLSSSWKATSTKSSLVGGGGGGWSSAAATAVVAVVVKTEAKNENIDSCATWPVYETKLVVFKRVK